MRNSSHFAPVGHNVCKVHNHMPNNKCLPFCFTFPGKLENRISQVFFFLSFAISGNKKNRIS